MISPVPIALSNFSSVDLKKLPSTTRGEARIVRARRVIATRETLTGYGHLVDSFSTAPVKIVSWPVTGRRGLVPGIGDEAGTVENVFTMERKGSVHTKIRPSRVKGEGGETSAELAGDEPLSLSLSLSRLQLRFEIVSRARSRAS